MSVNLRGSGEPITVWHVFGAMDIGGAELRTLELGAALAQRNIQFHYVTLSGREGELADRIRASGSRIRPIRLSLGFPFRFFVALRKHQPQVLDSHVATFSGLLVFLAWLARVPVRIAHFRSDGDGHVTNRRRRLQRGLMVLLIDGFATDIVGVSPSSLTLGYRANWRSDSRAKVIPNGLGPMVEHQQQYSLRQLMKLDQSALIIIHVGRPSREKNRPLAVSILSAAREAGENAHLVFIGGHGVDAEGLEAEMDARGVGDYVHHLGTRNDVRSLMAQADVLVLTSIREGLPGVVLESLSVGTPVVSTPLPGVAFIGEAVPGVVTVKASDLAGWVSALRGAPNGSVERDHIRSRFKHGPFSLRRSCDDHSAIYCRRTRR